MNFGNFDHYGYDADNYSDCMELIRQTNIRNFRILNKWFLIINILFLVFSLLNMFGTTGPGAAFYPVYIIIAAAFEVFMHVFGKSVEKFTLPIIYIDILMLMTYGILMSAAQPDMTATMFMVLMVVVAVLYMDTFRNMVAVMAVFTAVFIAVSFNGKSAAIAFQDMCSALVFFSLAVTLHFTLQRSRMQRFIALRENIFMQRELEMRNGYDALTLLLDRSRFFAIAGNILKTGHTDYMALCLIDLDGVKQINDRLGYRMGDKAIQIAGSILSEVLDIDLSKKEIFQDKVITDKLTFAGRLGGDEFIILIRGRNGREEVLSVLQEVLSRLNGTDCGELKGIHASFGVTEITGQDTDIDDAYHRADEALYESKRSGKNRIRFSDQGETKADG